MTKQLWRFKEQKLYKGYILIDELHYDCYYSRDLENYNNQPVSSIVTLH